MTEDKTEFVWVVQVFRHGMYYITTPVFADEASAKQQADEYNQTWVKEWGFDKAPFTARKLPVLRKVVAA